MATYNWIITCGCDNPAEYSCNTCGEKFCSNCKETHLQNTTTRHHSMVEYAKKLMPGNVSSPICPDHDDKECICWCRTCSKAVCIDCVITTHHAHTFTKLETFIQEKRASLQRELENLETKVLPEWNDQMILAKNITSDFLNQVNGVEEELEGRGNEFRKRVEEILENHKKQLNEMKTSTLAILYEQEKRVSEGLEKVKQEIKECEDRLRDFDMESLLECEDTNLCNDVLPSISYAIPPVFTSGQIDTKPLIEMFGKLTNMQTRNGCEGQSQHSIDTSQDTQKSSVTKSERKPAVPESTEETTALGTSKPVPASPKDTKPSYVEEMEEKPAIPDRKPITPVEPPPPLPEKKPFLLDKKLFAPEITQASGYRKPVPASPRITKRSLTDKTAPTESAKQLISEPKVHSHFDSKFLAPSLACGLSGLALVQTGDKKLQLADRNGLVEGTMDTDFDFDDVVSSPQGDILMSDYRNNCIKAISAEKTVKTLCNLQWKPSGLCCLPSGNIAVTFPKEGRVIIYSTSGKVVKKLDKKLFRHPFRVAQSKVNSDLYITDKTSESPVSAAGKVLSLDKDYKVRYEYTSGPGDRELFSPCGLCTDELGHVLITDINNHKVHILDRDGQFLQYLLTGRQGLFWTL